MSLRTIFSILSFCLLLLPLASHADEPLRVDPIYGETFARCSTMKTFGAKAILQSFSLQAMKEGAAQGMHVVSLSPQAIAEIVITRGLSPQLVEKLHSPAFDQALNSCFGQNKKLKQTYVAGLVASDVGGKIAVAALVVGTGFVVGRILAAVGASYPLLAKGLVIGISALVVYRVYSSIRDVLRDPTPQEYAQAQALIRMPASESNSLVAGTIQILQEKIEDLKIKDKDAQGADRQAIEARINKLTQRVEQLKKDQIETSNLKIFTNRKDKI